MIYDVSDPASPQYVGCNGDDGYVHDAQCVVYTGPDTDYQGGEVGPGAAASLDKKTRATTCCSLCTVALQQTLNQILHC